jgi:hypothetical protein
MMDEESRLGWWDHEFFTEFREMIRASKSAAADK